jgi:alpha-ribazole phosphatase
MRLYLVRHPQPDVPPGLCYGRTDVAANESDIARVLAALALTSLPQGAPVYSSHLVRAASLARRFSAVTPVLDARLAEMDFGAWEMRSWNDIPRTEVEAWNADLLHYRPGGGENVLTVATRVAAFRDELRQRGHEHALIICHAGTIRLLASLHQGGSLEQAALRAAQSPHRIAYGEVVGLED